MFNTLKADWYFIIPATLIWLAALIVTAWDFIYLQEAAFHLEFIKLIGVSLILIGLALRMAARKALGHHFSYALRIIDQHELVTTGIYTYIRHPAYSGDLLFHYGVTLLFSSLYGFMIMLLLIPCFLYRIRVEENMLSEQFGQEYLEYMQTTKKLLPYLY
jgi:protein-S-isoprenylcysteine O-methyltransferase Ste14